MHPPIPTTPRCKRVLPACHTSMCTLFEFLLRATTAVPLPSPSTPSLHPCLAPHLRSFWPPPFPHPLLQEHLVKPGGFIPGFVRAAAPPAQPPYFPPPRIPPGWSPLRPAAAQQQQQRGGSVGRAGGQLLDVHLWPGPRTLGCPTCLACSKGLGSALLRSRAAFTPVPVSLAPLCPSSLQKGPPPPPTHPLTHNTHHQRQPTTTTATFLPPNPPRSHAKCRPSPARGPAPRRPRAAPRNRHPGVLRGQERAGVRGHGAAACAARGRRPPRLPVGRRGPGLLPLEGGWGAGWDG